MFKKVLPLSAILSLGFLGLFLVLPMLSVYALSLEGATPFLVGVVVGGYALTQVIFQIPFGKLSDSIGRKPTLLIGLSIFFIGSLIAAFATDIYMLMLGRFLQGAGAIGSVITAMISDLVPEEVRGKAMAIMGGSIALAFALSMILGPVIGGNYGVDVLFMITASLAILSVIILFTKVPTPPRIKHTYHEKSKISDILKDKNILSMIVINAMQKGLMTFAFVLIPIFLTKESFGFNWENADLYKAYVPAMILGILAMGPAAIFGEKKNIPREIFLISIVLFFVSFVIMGFTNSDVVFVVGVAAFFIAFNMMEPLVQSMISKFAKVHQKGTALGLSNSVAYFMTFIGGISAGALLHYADEELITRDMIGMILAGITFLWLLWTLRLSNPLRHAHLYIPQADVDMNKLSLLEKEHIAEWYINETENLIVIKYEAKAIDEEELKAKICK